MPSDDSGAEEKAFPCLKLKHVSYIRLIGAEILEMVGSRRGGWLRQDSGQCRL